MVSPGDHSSAQLLYEAVFHALPDAVIVFSVDGTIMEFNPAAELLFKISRTQVIGRLVADALVPEPLRAESDELRYSGIGDVRRFRSYGLRGDGSIFPTEMRLSLTPWPVPGLAEGMAVFVGLIRDRSTDPVQVLRVPQLPTNAAEPVVEVRENLSVALQSAPVIVFVTDVDGIIQVSTGALVDTFDLPPGLVGQNIFTLFADRADITDHYRRALSGEQFRVRVQIGDRWFDTQYQPLFFEDGELRGTVGVSVEITAQIVSEDALRLLSETDSVTGLASRPHTETLLEAMVCGGGALTVMVVDLDQFKDVNDSHGHTVGDQVLHRIGERIRTVLPSDSVLGRLGGDELLVGLHTGNRGNAAHVAEDILAAVAAPMRIDVDDALGSDIDITITASIGLAVAPRDGDTIATLLTHADAAMYAAKRSGRAAYTFYRGDADESSRRLTVSTRLRRAVAAGDLHVEYQPIHDLRDGTVTSFEALARWNDPHLGAVSPVEFIRLAEASRLIEDLFDLVLHDSLRAAVAWNAMVANATDGRADSDRGPVVSVNVNVAARQLRDPQFPRRIVAAADLAGFASGGIVLELTESAVMNDWTAAKEVLHAIKDAGMGVALDDYGTGYSNMARLEELCAARILDTVKIDRSFVAALPAKRARTLITMLMTMTEALGVSALAEGLETQVQLDIVRRLGCRYGQGWHLAKPMPADAARQLVGVGRTAPPSSQ